MRSLLWLIVLGVLSACNSDHPTQPPQTSSQSITNIHTLDNNGDKIRWQQHPLQQGTVVFNVTMQEQGVATGRIVVVSKHLPKTKLQEQFEIVEKVGISYTLVPLHSLDLATAARSLLAMPENSMVEILIDYSPIPGQNPNDF